MTLTEKHRAKYAPFVGKHLVSRVAASFGIKNLGYGMDCSFNNIPLIKWDSFAYGIMSPDKTPASRVCVAKEAARQAVELYESNR